MPLISLEAIAASSAQDSGETPICLVKVQHADLTDPLFFCSAAAERVSDDPLQYGIVSNGDTYLYAERMAARLPDRDETAILTSELVFDNNDRALLAAIEAIFTPFTVSMSVVLASTPDVIEVSFPGMLCRLVKMDLGSLSVDLSDDMSIMEPAAADRMTIINTPGVHIQ